MTAKQKEIATYLIKAIAELTHSVSNIIGENAEQKVFDNLCKADMKLNEVTENEN